MDVYLINLDRREDRLKSFQAGAKLAGLSFKRIQAVDGKLLNTKDYWLSKYDNLDRWRYLKRGEIASYLSHFKAFEDSTKDTIMVFEDDAKLPYDFWWRYNIATQHLPDDWDIALLGTTSLWQRKYRQRCHLKWENDYWARYEGDIYGLQGYIVKREAIQFLKDCKFPIDAPNDVKFSNLGLNVYVIKEDLVSTHRLGSDSQ